MSTPASTIPKPFDDMGKRERRAWLDGLNADDLRHIISAGRSQLQAEFDTRMPDVLRTEATWRVEDADLQASDLTREQVRVPRYRVLGFAGNRDLAFDADSRHFLHRYTRQRLTAVEESSVNDLLEQGLAEVGALLFADVYAVVLTGAGKTLRESLRVTA